MGSLGAWEIMLILLVVLLVFGAKRIPEIARGLGKGIREFKDATSDIKRELSMEDTHRVQPPPQPTAPRAESYQASHAAPPPAPPPQPARADNPSTTEAETRQPQ